MDTFYNDKPIPLLETYKFIAEILNENPVLFQFLLSLDLKKYKLNDVIAPVIWAFFADPSKNLNKAKKTQSNDKSKDKAEQLLNVLISKLINAFSENERTLLNLRDFLQEQLDKDNDLVIYIRDFINVFLAQYKDSKDKLRKLILKMVVALEVMKADKKSDDVANQQDQLVKLIKNFFAASPRLKVKIVDLVVDVQTMHNLIPSNLYTKLGFK
ncbi:hypothetical protein K502DRAFT_327912 [Neoconidiobolus thromboides FSU 785]|nr:hypothetical protein K502DRAFT_327912 [Neoconidiobolus thromboides FSU 785]